MGQNGNTVGTLSYNPEKSEEGYNLFYPNNQSNTYLIDNCGQIINVWTDHEEGRNGAGAHLDQHGYLHRVKTSSRLSGLSFGAGGSGGIIEILDWDSNVIYEYIMADSLNRQHHDFNILPNGNILFIGYNRKLKEEIVNLGFDTLSNNQQELWFDCIFELNVELDSIVWRWCADDHVIQDFDNNKVNYGEISKHPNRLDINYQNFTFGRPDFMHSNAVDYNESLDLIALSVRNFNEVWIIDHSTTIGQAKDTIGGKFNKGGDILFRWGNPEAYQMGDSSSRQLFYQHDVQWIDEEIHRDSPFFGGISLYNNAINDTFSLGQVLMPILDSDNFEFSFNDSLGYLPSGFTTSFSHPDTARNFSFAASSLELLENGNIVMLAGREGFMFELDPNGEVVWEYEIPIKAGQAVPQGFDLFTSDNFTFQNRRYSTSFPGLIGQDLTPKGYVELDPNEEFCKLLTSTIDNDGELENLNVEFHQNQIEFNIERNVEFRIIDYTGNTILTREIYQGNSIINLESLPSGLYYGIIYTDKVYQYPFFKY